MSRGPVGYQDLRLIEERRFFQGLRQIATGFVF